MRHSLCAFALLTMACACGEVSSSPTCAAEVASVVWVGSDYSSSLIGALPLDGSPASFVAGTALGGDPVHASSQGQRFYIARDLDTLCAADGCGHSLLQISARETGDSRAANPQDVAVASDGSLWIARGVGEVYESPLPSIFITSPADARAQTTIDLSTFDADGNPDASSIRILNGFAFVALERLTSSKSIQPSMLAVIDTSSLGVKTSVTQLQGRNPFGLMKRAQRRALARGARGIFSTRPGSGCRHRDLRHDYDDVDFDFERVRTSALR